VESNGITLNKRELRLLKEYMGHHGWNDLLVSHPNNDPLYKPNSIMIKQYGGLRPKFKMTAEEIDNFRRKLNI
jgi:hypothetical protein